VIRLEDLTKRYDNASAPAVDRVSFRIEKSETVVLLGGSGSGKTTTLKMINRLIEPTSGSVEIDGNDAGRMDVIELRRSVGYVFQNIGLFPHLSVAENVQITPRLLGWPRARRRGRSDELLDLVGLDPNLYASRRPHELSGGQQQRVGIARALAADPDYLLMDEPFGALDAVTRDQLQTELETIKSTLGKAIVFVTHDLFEALRLGDRIGVMNRGRLEQIGRRDELFSSPETPYVRTLVRHAHEQAERLTGSES